MHDPYGYRTLVGRLREHLRAYVRKQIELPKQEIGEIVRANLKALVWFGVALAFALLFFVSLVVLVVALIAIVLPLWAAALVALVLFALGAGLTGWIGYKKLELRGPTRSIESFKETVLWAKARLLGRSAS